MKEPWMMFTKTQAEELKDNTDHEWTTINSVNGRKFTSKTDSSKYIFLPAGGRWDERGHDNNGSSGDYWSTAYFDDSYFSWYLYFTSRDIYMENYSRYTGQSIRPVAPKRPW